MRKLIVFLLLISVGLINAQTKYVPVTNMKELEAKLNANAAKTNTIMCDFVQEKHLSYLQDTIISKGKFWFQKENQLRWEYMQPYKYIIVISNGKFIIKDNNKKSEFDINSNKAFKEVNNLIVSSVRGTLMKDAKFQVTAFQNATSYLIKLTPKDKNMKAVLKQVELYFNISDLTIYKVKMIENQDDYTIINFKNRKINEKILPAVFIVK